MYNNFNVKRFMKTKLIRKRKNGSNNESNREQNLDDSVVYANLGGVREMVIRESVYEPVSAKRLIKYFHDN